MTTTVTTTTINAVTAAGLVGALGAICTIVLIGFLVMKEILGSHSNGGGSSGGSWTVRWARVLNIGILPLAFAFAVIVVERVSAAM